MYDLRTRLGKLNNVESLLILVLLYAHLSSRHLKKAWSVASIQGVDNAIWRLRSDTKTYCGSRFNQQINPILNICVFSQTKRPNLAPTRKRLNVVDLYTLKRSANLSIKYTS